MDFGSKYNTRSPAVKRLMREAMEFHKPTDQYCAQPVEDNLFEWHFTVRGPPDTDFADGRYHGRITLPAEYPMKPPSIMLLTPNGRFETGKKICLSMSAHHPETWQPSWSIRTVLLAIIGFMPSKGEGAIGALDYTSQERKRLAKKSQTWKCDSCACDNATCLVEGDTNGGKSVSKEALELASQISFKDAREKTKSESTENDREEEIKEPSRAEAVEEVVVSSEEKSDQMTDDTSNSHEKEANRDAAQDAERDAAQDADRITEQRGLLEATNDIRQRPIENKTISESQPTVRKRTENTSTKGIADPTEVKQTKEKPKKSSGVISLILLWVIIIALLVLIFRRLCLDSMIIGS